MKESKRKTCYPIQGWYENSFSPGTKDHVQIHLQSSRIKPSKNKTLLSLQK